jgi:phosphoribosyl 1,2-cyclic phosphodiesterase
LNKAYIKFWGVRGSNPTPDQNKMKYGGDTSCVEIRTSQNDVIILDMGTGIRKLGEEIIKDSSYPKEINIFLSHYHWDHIIGFLYFKPLYDAKYTINIYGYNKKTSMSELSNALINKSFWPVEKDIYKAKINFIDLPESSNQIKSIKLNENKIYYSLHPHPNGANSFKVDTKNKQIVYVTDCEHPEGRLNKNVVNIAQGCDILIHDSHFSIKDFTNYKGWGHSSWKQAVDVAITAEVKQLVLFHYCPDYDDSQVEINEKNAQKKFINTIAAYQGLSIEI